MLTILGPTASGKTELACHLALQLNGEIISADSRQVYKGMDIGTGKDLSEYTIQNQQIPVHLIDLKEPGYKYNIAEFQDDFHAAKAQIDSRKKLTILCGGSGLYIETALRGNSYLGIPSDPNEKELLLSKNDDEIDELYSKCSSDLKKTIGSQTKLRKIRTIQVSRYLTLNSNWKQRNYPKIDTVIIGLKIDRDLRREKITARLSSRLNNGLIEEAESLLSNGLSHKDMAYYGLEYKWLSDFLLGEITKKELFFGLNTAIHQFSKRQMTWFRRMEKNGYNIHWIDAALDLDQKLSEALAIYND